MSFRAQGLGLWGLGFRVLEFLGFGVADSSSGSVSNQAVRFQKPPAVSTFLYDEHLEKRYITLRVHAPHDFVLGRQSPQVGGT